MLISVQFLYNSAQSTVVTYDGASGSVGVRCVAEGRRVDPASLSDKAGYARSKGMAGAGFFCRLVPGRRLMWGTGTFTWSIDQVRPGVAWG